MTNYLFCHYDKPQFSESGVLDILCGVHKLKMRVDGEVMVLNIDDTGEVTYWHVSEYWPPDYIPTQVKDEIWGRTCIDGSQEFILVSWNFDAKLVHVYDGVEK